MSKSTSTALLTEHFRYTPLTLLDDIINTVNELVFRSVNGIEEGLSNASPEQLGFQLSDAASSKLRTEDARQEILAELKQNEIDNGIVQLESLLNATVDKDFDKFEIYTLRNILAAGHEEEDLARWIRLEHYSDLDVTANSRSPEEIQLQRRKLQETTKLNAMLKAEETKNAAILSQMNVLLQGAAGPSEEISGPLAFLHAPAAQATTNTESNMTHKMEYALKQLPALQALLKQLTGALALTAASRTSRHEETDPQTGERRRYLDARSRRALEKRGVEAESSVASALIKGKRVGRDEVEGIEAVVKAIRASQSAAPEGHDSKGD